MATEGFHPFYLRADGEPKFPLYLTPDAWSTPTVLFEKEEKDLNPEELKTVRFISKFAKDHGNINIRDVLDILGDDLLYALLVSKDMSIASSMAALRALKVKRKGESSFSASSIATPASSGQGVVIEETPARPGSPSRDQ